MKLSSITAAAALALSASATLAADTLKLKDGTIIEGKILEETPTSVTIEFGAAVKETTTIPRTKIASVDKETPDETAYEMLRKLLPTKDLMTSSDYDALLEGDLKTFTARFKDSKYANAVGEIIAQLTDEKAKTDAGGVKIDGEWITGEEAAKDAYNHAARISFARMKAAAAGFDYTGALAHFNDIRKNQPVSLVYSDAIAAAKELLPKYDAVLQRLERENVTIMAEREQNLRSTDLILRQKTERAFEARMATFRASRETAREKGQIWLPISKWDAESLGEARATIVKETEALGKIDVEKQRAIATTLAATYQSLAAGNLIEAASLVSTARTKGGSSDPTISALYERIYADVKAAKEAEVAAEKAAKAAELAELASKPAVTETGAGGNDPKGTKAGGGNNKTGSNRNGSGSGDVSGNGADGDGDGSAKKGGLPFSTLLMIIAGIMVVVTLLAKTFMSSPEENAE